MNTQVGGSGSHLSGGERQRVTIARAMLKDAPGIVLDEATAFVDPENEYRIQKALGALTGGKTLVVVAHRLSTIVNAKRIYVLDKGRVVDSGSHSDLLGSCGLYASMWKTHMEARSAASGTAVEGSR